MNVAAKYIQWVLAECISISSEEERSRTLRRRVEKEEQEKEIK